MKNFLLLFLLLIGMTNVSSAQADITLCVDMTCLSSATAPTVFGAFNGWNAGANPVTDPDGDGIFCATVTMTAGAQEYKFFRQEGEEALTPGSPCTVTSGPFTNRVITVVDGVNQSVTFGWESCDATCPIIPQADITFCVDMNCLASATAPSVFGAFNGWNAGANQVTDPDNDGVYCATVTMPVGDQEYKFFVQEEGEEGLDPTEDAACTTTNFGFTNRVITVVDGVAQTVTFGWESCDATCPALPAADITFCVDMNCLASTTAPSVFGSFNGWNAGANQVTDPDNDGVFCTTVNIPEGNYEYKFFVQEEGEEGLDPTEDAACTTTNFGFTNRVLTVVAGVDQTVTSGWETCDATCPSLTPSDITLCVDMTCVPSITAPTVFGAFNGWCAGCTPITDADGDGIYCATVTMTPGAQEFKFFIQEGEEVFTPGAPCTTTNFGFTNRLITVTSGVNETFTFGWESCDEECFVPPTPMMAAPTPTAPVGEIISLFSNAYTDVTIQTWNTGWSSNPNSLTDLQIDGNDTKLYEGLGFNGINFDLANSIDASEMNTFHLDFWTPNINVFTVVIVDFGADNAFGGGDDTESAVTISGFPKEEWVSFEFPLSAFGNLASTEHISQIIIVANDPYGAGKVWIDNVYFRNITPPSILCRQPVSTYNTPGSCSAEDLILLDAFTIDPSGVGGTTMTSDRPVDFPIGTTIVTWTLTNADATTSSCEQEVTVTDNDFPVVGPCNSIHAFIDPNTCTALIPVTPDVTDNCSGTTVTGIGNFSYGVGLYNHVITATDVNGNVTVHNLSIEVHDSYAPEFANCTEEEVVLTSTDGSNVAFPTALIPSASDNCGLAGVTNDIPAAGLPVGATTVTFTAADPYGNITNCAINITVEGAPNEISLHPSGPIEASLAENETTQVVTWNPLNANTQCAFCTETSLDGFTYIGTFWGHQYFLADEVSATRQDAQLIAEGYDSHLAVISSLEENNYLKEALSNEVRTAWIGLMPQLQNGEWSFVWDNNEANEFNSLALDLSDVTEDTRIVLSQEGNWVAATNAEEKYFLIERPCVDFTQVAPLAPNTTTEVLRSGDAWPEGSYEVTYEVVDMCGNESVISFDVDVQPEVADFCATEATNNSIWIEAVTFHELTNNSTSNDGYADFTAQTTSMNIGDGVVLLDLKAGGNDTEEVLYWRVWLDKNNDGDFFDANEVLFEQSSVAGHIQANVALDLENIESSRLRVAVSLHEFPAPCGNPYVGEIEDYTVTLTVTEQLDTTLEREAQVQISPNPASTYVNLDLSDFAGQEVTIRIFNNLGKAASFEQKVVAGQGNISIDLNGFATGMYNVSVSTNKRQVTKRLVVSSTNRPASSAK